MTHNKIYMRRLQILIVGLFSFLSCHKPEQPINNPTVYIENNIVFIDINQRIVKIFTTAENHIFIRETNYYYSDSLVLRSYYDSASNYQVSRYKIGKNGYALYSIDTIIEPSDQDTTTDSVIYHYDSEGYLSTSNSFPGLILQYNYENGDLQNVENMHFSYYDTLNKIELSWFQLGFFPYGNGITGKINKHLVKQLVWYIAHGLTISNFQYSIDTNGYVSQQKETLIAGQYTYYYLKRYTYIFNYAP
jgi:hypothetical protein